MMHISDDTGTKYMLGKIELEKGHFKTDSYLKRDVLESRVSLFQRMNNYPQSK
ncbi:hypothetical protein [Commensalibacter nepenthis]|uniref:Uncharacterized protein n=1 Tax=Commensalibacter nepenthis TaxID=3043872 RepID=A0ABT6Q6V0_9PROT|nr:hypothetical protein [Commensalibacter sp. TBRC 10068]MDI2112618.1 hypothetical protein [Commensalibacter sp. TBRC 10068]